MRLNIPRINRNRSATRRDPGHAHQPPGSLRCQKAGTGRFALCWRACSRRWPLGGPETQAPGVTPVYQASVRTGASDRANAVCSRVQGGTCSLWGSLRAVHARPVATWISRQTGVASKQWHLEVGRQTSPGGLVTAACGTSWSPSLLDPAQRTEDVAILPLEARCQACQAIDARRIEQD